MWGDRISKASQNDRQISSWKPQGHAPGIHAVAGFYLRAPGIVSFTCFAEWWMSSSGEDGAEAGFFQDGGYFFSLIALDFDIAIFHSSASAA
jgi:hypothetical protein